jgi:hypothetical protein
MKAEMSVGLMIVPALPIAALCLFGLSTGKTEWLGLGVLFYSLLATPFLLVGCISIFFVKLDRVRKTIYCMLSVVILALLTWQFVGWMR